MCVRVFVFIYMNVDLCQHVGGAFDVLVIVKEMDTVTRVQILDETDCISHSTNTLGKGMNPVILPPPRVNSRTDWVLQPW